MSKQEHYFRKIAEYKERFRNLSIEMLKGRLSSGFLYKEAAIAIRELIEEREQLLEESSAERICLIQSLSALHGTCYFEFLPGKYKGKCWNQNSVFLTEEVFGYLEPVFERNQPDFDHYAFVEIQKETWMSVISDFCQLLESLEQAHDVQELEDKVGFTFRDSGACFTSDFRSNAAALIDTVRELSQWIETQLQSHDSISVLGM